MTREIKYRVWDKLNKRWLTQYQIGGMAICNLWEPTIAFEFLEYTGLHDKQGKEIHEGDVVSLLPETYATISATVEWSETEHCWVYRRTDNSVEIHIKWAPVEVIGNIYEPKGGK